MKKTLSLILVLALLLGAVPAVLAAGTVHEHVYDWETGDGICTVCGNYCRHTVWLDGVCQICGAHCAHPGWQDGRCTLCHMLCPHEHHDGNNMRCTVCLDTDDPPKSQPIHGMSRRYGMPHPAFCSTSRM